MSRYKEIRTRIKEYYSTLPKNQKKIADFIVDNLDKVPFLSVQDISEKADVSVASTVRFAQRIGFSGFLEMREDIAKNLQVKIQNKEMFPLFDEGNIKKDILTYIANQDIKNINDTLNSVDRGSLDKSIELIRTSSNIYTAGLGISYLLAEILAYQLKQVAIKASAFTHNYASFLEQALFLEKNDLLILFSLPPYSKETIEAAKQAKENNVKVIAITNKATSPITKYSDVELYVKSENILYTNSFAAISVLINSIATECAIGNKEKAESMIRKIDEINEKQNFTIK
jgi:DNA-binding MurR/RpiR family transcriptional regulator